MLVFLTGASGFVGRHVIEALQARGHSVLGLVRSDKGAETVSGLGATPFRGSLDDVDSLRAGASQADAVIHCGFNHDFTNYVKSCADDLVAVKAMIETLGKDKPFIGTSGPVWDVADGVMHENQDLNGLKMHSPRGECDLEIKRKGDEGYKTAIMRLPPSVHGHGDGAFIPVIISASKRDNHVGYVGDGAHKWIAVHVKDAAKLYVATLEGLANGSIPGGQTVHAGEDTGYATKEIAEIIAEKLGNIDIGAITPEQSIERYSPFIGGMWANQRLFDTDITRKLTGWEPKENTLVEDLKGDVYFK